MFISIDGGDGCGKSVQLERLRERFAGLGRDVVVCRDPGGTPLAERVRALLLHGKELDIAPVSEMLLFMAARSQLVVEVIRPALAARKIVLCDRFLLATIVYQGYAGGVPLDAILDVGRVATGGLLPGIGIVLDVPRAVAVERMRGRGAVDRMEEKGDAYHEKVRNGFLAHAATDPERYHVIDATQTIEAVAEEIWNIVGGAQYACATCHPEQSEAP